jgi:predicted DNA-binding transcriptional regulator YafY
MIIYFIGNRDMKILKQKHSYDKALYRLVSIIAMLLKDERPTIKSLAEEFNVGIRTIQKDVYQRLTQFDIEKDPLGHLKFSDSFIFTQIDMKKVS